MVAWAATSTIDRPASSGITEIFLIRTDPHNEEGESPLFLWLLILPIVFAELLVLIRVKRFFLLVRCATECFQLPLEMTSSIAPLLWGRVGLVEHEVLVRLGNLAG